MHLRLHAPPAVQLGEVLLVRIDIEVAGGVREVSFTMKYDKSRLVLVGWSEGDFARHAGVPTALGAEEPSDGNIEVRFKTLDGPTAAGAGTVAVLRFEAVKAGGSRITLRNAAVDSGGGMNAEVLVPQEGFVTIH